MSTVKASISQRSAAAQPGEASGPLVVAMIYNHNGMASWCWEAAHALHELGRNVLLIAGFDTALPGTPAMEVIRIDSSSQASPRRSGIGKAVSTARNLLTAAPDGVLEQIHRNLADRGVQPAAYILNQSTLVDRKVPAAQLVAAWSYPVDLLAYVRKTPYQVADHVPKEYLRTALSAIGWWRRDWRAYRAADGVLAVSQVLLDSLRRRSVRTVLAHPGTCVSPVAERSAGGIRLLMAAVHLGESRKRIRWMLEAMKEMHPPSGTALQLAGNADDAIRRAASRLSFPVEFLGHLERQELQQVMQRADIFCFGSVLDDWGYVLVEAMANGLIPVAPAISPFDEILDQVGCCYRVGSQEDFVRALQRAISGAQANQGQQAWHRAQALFSRPAFGSSILASLESLPKLR